MLPLPYVHDAETWLAVVVLVTPFDVLFYAKVACNVTCSLASKCLETNSATKKIFLLRSLVMLAEMKWYSIHGHIRAIQCLEGISHYRVVLKLF